MSVSTMPNSALQFFTTTVDNTTPQPITFSVCGSQALTESGLRVYMQTKNITTGTPMLELFDQTASNKTSTPCLLSSPTTSGIVPGVNVSVQLYVALSPCVYTPNETHPFAAMCHMQLLQV